MSESTVLVSHNGPVAVVQVNRPEKLNALNHATVEALDACFETLAEQGKARAVVLTGSGDKAFVAGADIGELRDQQPVAAERFSRVGQRLMRRIERMPVPVIAAINGYALGGGLELALGCHIRLASETARLGLPEIKLGLLPGFGGTQRLARAVGRGQATLMMLGGDPVDAATALRIGLVQKVIPADALLDDAMTLAQSLAGQAPLAVSAILDAVDRGLDMPLDAALDYESARFGLLCASDDMREGTSAFLEKRKPEFKGC